MRVDGWLLIVLAFLLVAGCTGPSDGSDVAGSVDNGSSNGTPEAELGEGDGEADANATRPWPNVTLETVVDGLAQPTRLTSPPDDTGRLFVVEQPGRVRVLHDGSLADEPYLNITDRTEAANERGFVGLAFAPDFAESGRLFVSYTTADGGEASVLRSFTVDDPATSRPAGNGTELLRVEQPSGLHNGGHITFGPDGYLYYGLGDGGPGGDPDEQGQDATTVLGSILRLEVSGEEAKAPSGNPFVGSEEGHDMIWAYGLRNPWRFSFDRGTGDLFIGDVGQSDVEEVNHQPAGSEGGENYGWDFWEGDQRYEGNASREGFTFPAFTYEHGSDGRCAVIGGHVYRGEAIADLEGTYLFGDLCAGTISGARNTTEGWQTRRLLDTDLKVTAFGEDPAGEIYVLGQTGSVHRLVETTQAAG